MKKLLLSITYLTMLSFFIFPVFSTVYAQTQTEVKEYAVLAPLPGITDEGCVGDACKTTLERYLPNMFNLMVGIAVTLAFIMIAWGGFTYATSDALMEKQDGKGHIESGIYGLLIVIGAWLILYTINPQILNFDLIIARPDIKAGVPTVTAGVPMKAEEIAESKKIQSELAGKGGYAYKGPCEQGQTTQCVNLNGLPQNAISGLLGTKKACGDCSIVITGGTEGGHATHGAGAPVVDLRPGGGLNAYLKVNNPVDGTKIFTSPNGAIKGPRATYVYETAGGNSQGTSTGAHWHVIYQ